ncbi:MAG: helix-turn-helix domain-containing protein [Vicinamibacterales bacterium]
MKVVVESDPRLADGPTAAGVDPSRVMRVPSSRSRVDQLLTVAEAAQCVGCCEETIRRAYLARQLDVLRFGARRVRIRPGALTAWLERGGKTTAA